MELIDYPKAIADGAKQYLILDRQVRQVEKEIDRLKLEISSQVYFDPALKNQNQRDCRRAELLDANSQYQALLTQLETVKQERNSLQIELRYLRDRFSALQLSLLAKLEFLSRAEDLNDIRVHLAGLGLQGLFSTYSGVRTTTPTDAANQIHSFVEALAARVQAGELTSDELWAQKVSTPEFESEEPEGSEFEDEG